MKDSATLTVTKFEFSWKKMFPLIIIHLIVQIVLNYFEWTQRNIILKKKYIYIHIYAHIHDRSFKYVFVT